MDSNPLDGLIAEAERFSFEGAEHGHGLPETFTRLLAVVKAARDAAVDVPPLNDDLLNIGYRTAMSHVEDAMSTAAEVPHGQ